MEVDVKEPTEAGLGLVSGSTSAEFDMKQSVVKRLVEVEVPKGGGLRYHLRQWLRNWWRYC